MALIDKIKNLGKQLYPTGRAFKMPFGGELEKINAGLAKSEQRVYLDSVAIMNGLLPDNDNFTEADATAWERRLRMIDGSNTSLENRKLAIKRKMNHPGTKKPRQDRLYIQAQLQAAGFDVYVYENIFDDGMGGFTYKTPAEFSLTTYPTIDIQHTSRIQHGQVRHGVQYGNKVANHIEDDLDNSFYVGDFSCSFFVGGSTEGSWTDVELTRKDEFRQLILKLKPAQNVVFLLINFI
jgi:hypothetical protein